MAGGQIVEAAKGALQVLQGRERLGAAPRALLAGERAGEEFGGVAQPLGADAKLVPLAHALMAEIGAPALDLFAEAGQLVPGTLSDRACPQRRALGIVLDRPRADLDPLDKI